MGNAMKHVVPVTLLLTLASAAAACQDDNADVPSADTAIDLTGSDGAVPDSGPGSPDADADASAMPPISDSVDPQIVSTLADAGIALDALPDLTTLKSEPGHARLRAVMKSFTIALGTTCTGCHDNGATSDAGAMPDFAKDTPRKNVARRMWTDFATSLQKKDGSAIYCDTCHQGRVTFLDRSNIPALRAWMKTNFVDDLDRKDGSVERCPSCHGMPFNGQFLADWRLGTSATAPTDAGTD
jgi:hypothetical protein